MGIEIYLLSIFLSEDVPKEIDCNKKDVRFIKANGS